MVSQNYSQTVGCRTNEVFLSLHYDLKLYAYKEESVVELVRLSTTDIREVLHQVLGGLCLAGPRLAADEDSLARVAATHPLVGVVCHPVDVGCTRTPG